MVLVCVFKVVSRGVMSLVAVRAWRTEFGYDRCGRCRGFSVRGWWFSRGQVRQVVVCWCGSEVGLVSVVGHSVVGGFTAVEWGAAAFNGRAWYTVGACRVTWERVFSTDVYHSNQPGVSDDIEAVGGSGEG